MLPATKVYYPKSHISIIKDFKNNFKDREVFEAQIVKISKQKHFVLQLALDDYFTILGKVLFCIFLPIITLYPSSIIPYLLFSIYSLYN